jgi:Gas vesicle synthesis protein GvpL/GvpF
VWMYAVAADGEEPLTGSPIGIGGGPVRTVGAAGLTAIVGDVGEPEFGEAALRRNLEDLDWLERMARAHHAVIKAAATRCPVVPMRFATVYASDEGVVQTLRQRTGDFREALARITARSEWGVKAYAAEPADTGPAPGGPPDGQASAGAGPGAAYLQRRRAQLMAHKTARQEATAGAQAVHAELGRLSVSARLYPPQSPDLAGRPTPMVLNAAYLVADERADEFAAAVTDLTARHRSVRLALTGPWPAYSFVGEGVTGEQR